MKRKKRFIILIIIVVMGILYYKLTYVSFSDKEFERYVRESIFWGDSSVISYDKRYTPVDGLITKKSLESVEWISLDLFNYNIKTLVDLKKFKNIKHLSLAYLPGKGIEIKGNIPKNFNVIYKLKNLEKIWFSNVNITSELLKTEINSVKSLTLHRCIIGETNFETRFPETSYLWIYDSIISSLAFTENMQELKTLQLGENVYQSSLDELSLLPELEEVSISCDTPEIFGLLPELPTVKELMVGQVAQPDETHLTEYFKWKSLNRINLLESDFEKVNGKWVEIESE